MEYSHELVMPNADIPFKLFMFEGHEGHYVRDKHWHRSVEIFAVFEGGLEFYINDTRYPLAPGQFMLVNSNEIHSVAAPEKNQTVVLQIPRTVFAGYESADEVIYFSHSARQQDAEMMSLIRKIYNTYAARQSGYELKVQGYFYMLVYLLVTKYRVQDVDDDLRRSQKRLSKLSAVTAYMKAHYQEPLSLERLAAEFGYSPTYLSRMFQKYAQTNYKVFLDNVRLEHAYNDLMNSSLGIGEIALGHGFANEKSFSKIFREKYGVLPSEFRKRQKNAINQ